VRQQNQPLTKLVVFLESIRVSASLADKADPFTKKRLLDLAIRYEAGLPVKTGPLPLPTINVPAIPASSSWSQGAFGAVRPCCAAANLGGLLLAERLAGPIMDEV
jgi:hypothetical protein